MYTAAPNAMPIGSRFRFICRTFSTSGSIGRASAGLACSGWNSKLGKVGTTIAIGRFREIAIESGKQAQSAVLLLGRHFDQQLSDFALPQESVAELKSPAIEAPDIFRSEMGTYGARSAAPHGCRCSLLST